MEKPKRIGYIPKKDIMDVNRIRNLKKYSKYLQREYLARMEEFEKTSKKAILLGDSSLGTMFPSILGSGSRRPGVPHISGGSSGRRRSRNEIRKLESQSISCGSNEILKELDTLGGCVFYEDSKSVAPEENIIPPRELGSQKIKSKRGRTGRRISRKRRRLRKRNN